MAKLSFTTSGFKSSVANILSEVSSYCDRNGLSLQVLDLKNGLLTSAKRITVSGDNAKVSNLAKQIGEYQE